MSLAGKCVNVLLYTHFCVRPTHKKGTKKTSVSSPSIFTARLLTAVLIARTKSWARFPSQKMAREPYTKDQLSSQIRLNFFA